MTSIMLPANGRGERYNLTYTYDGEINTYVTKVKDVFGYSSTSIYDYRFGALTSTIDINGTVFTYAYDEFGRLGAVFGPEIAMEPVIKVDYFTESNPAHARVFNYDNPGSMTRYETVTYVDGLGRTLQVKKQSAVEGSSAMVASGAVEYDFAGRVLREYEPYVTSMGTAYSREIRGSPVYYEYDEQGRQIRITNRDGTRVNFAYGISGQNYVTTVTDPNGGYRLRS